MAPGPGRRYGVSPASGAPEGAPRCSPGSRPTPLGRGCACWTPAAPPLHLAAASDLVALAPLALVTRLQALGLATAGFPLPRKSLRASLLWHPRHHHDPARERLRAHIMALATASR